MIAVCVALLVLATIACLYHLALTSAGRRRARQAVGLPRHRLAVLIPAHDEEGTVAATVRSARACGYPAELLQVLVVADNCTDYTASAARAAGAEVVVRRDPAHRGKGFALAFGLPHALADGADAVLVLDADCEISPGSLAALDAALSAGADVVQGSVSVRNPDAGVGCFVAAVGAAMDNAAGVGKGRLGLRVPLRGTGMAFRRNMLERFPWQAFGLAEDAEYADLLRAGDVRVMCEPAVGVWSDAPMGTEDLCGQRRRWRASLFVGKTGLFTRWLESKPLVLAQLAATVAVVPFGPTWTMTWAGGLILATAAVYLQVIAAVGLSARRARMLTGVPWVVARLLAVTVGGVFRRDREWQRTRREGEAVRAGSI